MASGLAVLAFDYAAAAQMIDSGGNGLLVKFADTQRFRIEAARLASQPSLVFALRSKARQAALQRGWQPVLDAVEAVYREAIGGHVPPQAPRFTATGLFN